MPRPTGPTVIELPPLTPVQAEIAACKARFRVCPSGRRVGKTHGGVGEAVMTAYRGGAVWWIAPDTNRLQPGLKALKFLVSQINRGGVIIEHRLTKAKSDVFRFPSPDGVQPGGYIEFRTANDPQVLRGDALDLAIFDEHAFMPPEAWDEAVSPMLIDRHGRALFYSTPFGRNQFYQLYMGCREYVEGTSPDPATWKRWTNDGGDPDWAAFRFATSANPFIAPEEIERERRRKPQRIFEQEYLAAFADDSSSVFRGVERVATGAVEPPQEGHVYIGGVDLARVDDFTVIVIMDATTKRMVYMERFRELDYRYQVQKIAHACDLYKPLVVWVETNKESAVAARMRDEAGLPIKSFYTGPTTKGPLIESWALAIETGDVVLLNDDVLKNEHLAYEMIPLSSGFGYKYDAPRGQHDDTVMASALAWYGVTQSGQSRGSGVARVDVSGLYSTSSARRASRERTSYQHAFRRRR